MRGERPLGLMARGRLKMVLGVMTSVLLLVSVHAWMPGSSELVHWDPSSESIDSGVFSLLRKSHLRHLFFFGGCSRHNALENVYACDR